MIAIWKRSFAISFNFIGKLNVFVETIQHCYYVFNWPSFDTTSSVIELKSRNLHYAKYGISDFLILSWMSRLIKEPKGIYCYSNYLDVSLLQVKWTFLVKSKRSSFICFLVDDVVNSWLLYILLSIMSIFVSNGILVNSDLTSNDSIWNPSIPCVLLSP